MITSKTAKELGKKGSDRYVLCKCELCGKERWVGIRKQPKLCRKCFGKQNHGKNHPSWKGGRITDKGYILIKMREHPLAKKNGYIMEHRLIAAERWGIESVRGMHVHHKNGNRADNRIENLEVMTIEEHLSGHFRTPTSNTKLPNEENYLIECACGCGQTRLKYDSQNRPRRFMRYHHRTVKERNVIKFKDISGYIWRIHE